MLTAMMRRGGGYRDRFFSQVGLLLPFDDDFNDRSINRRTPTVDGDPQISTPSPSGFGGCAEFDGTGDRLTFANHSAFDIGTGDFTIEVFFRVDSLSSVRAIASHGVSLSNGWNMQVLTTGAVRFTWGGANNIDTSPILSAGDRCHFVFGRSGGFFQRGFATLSGAGSWSNTTAWSDLSVNSFNFSTTSPLYIGANRDGSSLFLGGIDEFRLTVGVWRGPSRPTRPHAYR